MIHLYAPPGDFPDTLCGLSQNQVSHPIAVYGRDFHRVDCPKCLAKLQMPPVQPYTDQDAKRLRRGLRNATLIMLAGYAAALLVWLWLT